MYAGSPLGSASEPFLGQTARRDSSARCRDNAPTGNRDAGKFAADATQLPTGCQPESLAKPARSRSHEALSRSAEVLARRRVFRILRQIVGDLEPRRLAADEDVACRPHRWIVENGQRDAVLRQCAGELGGALPVRSRPVDDRGPAFTAEPAQVAARALVILDQVLALQPPEVFDLHPNAAAERRAMLLATLQERRACVIDRLLNEANRQGPGPQQAKDIAILND